VTIVVLLLLLLVLDIVLRGTLRVRLLELEAGMLLRRRHLLLLHLGEHLLELELLELLELLR
jgi:hypothetical protein